MQRTEILGSLHGWTFNKSYSRKDAKQDKKNKLAQLLDWAAASKALSDLMQPILYTLMIETGRDAVQQVGSDPDSFNVVDPQLIVQSRAQADRAATAIDAETEKQLRASLGQGIDNGETSDELDARVESVIGSALTMRTARIGTSESYRAMGAADVIAWTQTGNVQAKEWYTAEDEKVCVFCNSMDMKIVGLAESYLKQGSVFTVGGQSLKIDYGNVDTPPAHPSCRCVVLPVFD